MEPNVTVKPIPEWLQEIVNGDGSNESKKTSAFGLACHLLSRLASGQVKFVNPEHSFIIPRNRWRWMGSIQFEESCIGPCRRVMPAGSGVWIRMDRPRFVMCSGCYEQQSSLPLFEQGEEAK